MNSSSIAPTFVKEVPTFDVYKTLGLHEGTVYTAQEVDVAYTRVRSVGRALKKQTIAWKVLRDAFYARTYDMYKSFSVLHDAGFFVDGFSYDLARACARDMTLCAPVHHVSQNKSANNPVILLSTGSFSPLHQGHVSMMEAARKCLEESGYTVLGGFVSPSHDAYVHTKDNMLLLHAQRRVHLCQLALRGVDWLEVDPWESCYTPGSLNFTDVITHLEDLARTHVPSQNPIRVAYVFGSDNEQFARAFVGKGIGVCVGRDGAQRSVVAQELRARSAEVYFVKGDPVYAQASSTRARRTDRNLIPPSARSTYDRWWIDRVRTTPIKDTFSETFIIRDDRAYWTPSFIDLCGSAKIQPAAARVRSRVQHIFQNAFSGVHECSDVRIVPIVEDMEIQMRAAQALSGNGPMLNLDACTNEHYGHAIHMSRLFSLCDGQHRAGAHCARPGYPDLEQQMRQIPVGTYTLVDDDVASGKTMCALMCRLPEQVLVDTVATLVSDKAAGCADHGTNCPHRVRTHDVVDMRDFVVGARGGGLVVRALGGAIARAPYMFPYVSLYSRARLPLEAQMQTSIDLWKMNYVFYQMIGSVTLGQVDPAAQTFFTSLGYDLDTRMSDLILEHIKFLSRSTL